MDRTKASRNYLLPKLRRYWREVTAKERSLVGGLGQKRPCFEMTMSHFCARLLCYCDDDGGAFCFTFVFLFPQSSQLTRQHECREGVFMAALHFCNDMAMSLDEKRSPLSGSNAYRRRITAEGSQLWSVSPSICPRLGPVVCVGCLIYRDCVRDCGPGAFGGVRARLIRAWLYIEGN